MICLLRLLGLEHVFFKIQPFFFLLRLSAETPHNIACIFSRFFDIDNQFRIVSFLFPAIIKLLFNGV
jgi:hypothetical protein